MKKVLFFITLMPYLFFSQGHRFIYELKYKPDSTAEKAEKVEMVLDIGKKEVKFYDLEFLKVDSLSKKTGESWQTNSQTQQLLKRNLGEDKNLNYKDVMFDYYVIESDDKMYWQIAPETKMLGEHQVQKATTEFGGRKWTAWFSADFPINEGPYKFRGLPGMIFEVSDSKKHYFYTLVKNYNLNEENDTKKFLETHYGKKPIKIDYKKLNELKLNHFNDPYSWARQSRKWSVNMNGVIYDKPEQLEELKKIEQKRLRNRGNDIELNHAVSYPDK